MRLSGRPIRSTLMTIALLAMCDAVGFTQPAFPLHSMQQREKKHDVKRQIEALEEQWRTAQLAGDIAVMDKLLSDDYIGISMTGQVNTKTQQLERARNHKLVLTRLDLGDRQVKLVGSIAIVTSMAEIEGINEGAPVKGTFRYTRVYQRLPSGEWKITSFEATRVPSRDTVRLDQDEEPKTAKIPPPE